MAIYLDNAATTVQKPPAVAQTVYEILSAEQYGNPSRGAHGYSLAGYHQLEATRTAVKELFQAPATYEVAFTNNATVALNEVLKGLIKPGDHVLTTSWEHNSVLRPLYQLEAQGATLDFISSEPLTGQLRYAELEQKVRPETRVVVCNHASNVTGNLLDLDLVKTFCQQHGLYLVLDASQTAGVVPLDLSDDVIAAVCFTGHKSLYGPGGTGGAIVRKDLPLVPVLTGGDGMRSFSHTQPQELPILLEPGTANVAGLAGLRAGVDYVRTHFETIQQTQTELGAYFYAGLKQIPGLTLYGDFDQPRVNVFAVNLKAADSALVSDLLWEESEIATRPGYHCAPLIHEALGLKQRGAVRFSLSSFTTKEDLAAALQALKTLSAS